LAALFPAVPDSPEFLPDLMRSALEVTFESTHGPDVQLHGTIIADQANFSQSLQLLQTSEVDLCAEIRGTMLGEHRMVLTQESDWAVLILQP